MSITCSPSVTPRPVPPLGLAVAGFAPRIADVAPSPGSVLTFAAVCAGRRCCPTSTTRRRPPPAASRCSPGWPATPSGRCPRSVFDLTRGRRDHGKGTHRGLTHTAVGAVLLGLAVNLASAALGHAGAARHPVRLHRAGDQGPRRAGARAAVAGDRRRSDLGRRRSGCPAARPAPRGGWAPRWRSACWCTPSATRSPRAAPRCCGRCRSAAAPGTRSAAPGPPGSAPAERSSRGSWPPR